MELKPRNNALLRWAGSGRRSHRAHCVGLSVAAFTALIKAVAAMTSANWRYICPVIPGMNAGGINTDISTSVTPRIGANSSCIAAMLAWRGLLPRSMCWTVPSTTTMASSTTMPMASTTAKSVSRLMVKPIADMAAKEPMIVTGTVVAGTRVARQSCRNSTMTSSTSTPASNRV